MLETIKNQLPDALKDTKINIERIIMSEDHVLAPEQIALIALACSYGLRNQSLIAAIQDYFAEQLSDPQVHAAKICASLMAMNNVYYRFTHLVQDKSFNTLNPMLRMSGLASHGIAPIDFELAALALSALNGCGMCMDAHTEKLKTEHATLAQIQSAIRISAVLHALAVGMSM